MSKQTLKENGWEKICPTCGEKFLTKNRKKKFCSSYHKNVFHYETFLQKMKNKLEMDSLFKDCYAAIKTCYERGWYEVSPEILMILGFKRSATAMTGEYLGQKAIFYNDFALVAEKNNKVKILKMSSWRHSKI